ncbi:MepB family protein [Arthrobacter sp. fls2-241-R2A-172]|uniref:MepB family protein n=1 Tax=Arthrobacter sp. fls2-241-R2A-172 TaxID=3040325 RepID=UPI00254C1B24|nr:MepB family protein [Arthrobacter sp. fls2-241-R2A-172]
MSFSALKYFADCVQASDDPQPIIKAEEQNGDYESGVVLFGKEWWRIRTARITPTKPGAFVAVWKRDGGGSTRPFMADELMSGLMVFVEERGRFGVFRFSPSHLISLGYVTSEFHPGKRGFRVYPAWCSDLNPQASRTQRAQADAFVELPSRSVPWTETGRAD